MCPVSTVGVRVLDGGRGLGRSGARSPYVRHRPRNQPGAFLDIDTFLRARRPAWTALEAASRRPPRSAAEVDELLELYQQAATDLSIARTRYDEPALTAELTQLVARAQSRLLAPRRPTWQQLATAAATSFPAAVWHMRRAVAVSAAVLLLSALVAGWWVAVNPDVQNALLSPAAREAYLQEDFEAYYSSRAASEFASFVSANNARVGALAMASGVLLGIPTVGLLAFNGLNIGAAGGMFVGADRADVFFGLILPHGLLELTAIAVAGGAGLHLGWAVVVPGDRPRREAFAAAARRSLRVVVGLVLAFLVAGLVEAWVTPSGLSTPARIGIGATAWAAFVAWIGLLGPRSVRLSRST